MRVGVTIRNMGPQSTAKTMARCATAAEAAGLESAWVVDHIAIPPDDAEGSGGRYADPLTALAWLAGVTQRIQLGVGVLVLPYRAALPTVKQIASIQELSGERLILGVGVGWMPAEFSGAGYRSFATRQDHRCHSGFAEPLLRRRRSNAQRPAVSVQAKATQATGAGRRWAATRFATGGAIRGRLATDGLASGQAGQASTHLPRLLRRSRPRAGCRHRHGFLAARRWRSRSRHTRGLRRSWRRPLRAWWALRRFRRVRGTG